MAIIRRGVVNHKQIKDGIARAHAALEPDVVRIRYSIGQDWTGDESIYFKVVLSDEASKEGGLGAMAERVSHTVDGEVDPESLGLNSYFNFRSVSEQADLNEPAWA